MGAQNSTLKSIELLSSTLTSIEERLFEIEDVHLHHNQGLVKNSFLLVSGKQIACNPNVQLLVGPVVGLVGVDFCRILIEVDQDCLVSLHVFRRAPLTAHRFVQSHSFKALHDSPVAFTIPKLEAFTDYEVYIGGIAMAQVEGAVASFKTLSQTLEAHHIHLIHGDCAGINNPGEIIIWKQMAHEVRSSEGSTAMVHFGDLLGGLEESVWPMVVAALEDIGADDQDALRWEHCIRRFEKTIKSHYQRALASSVVTQLAARAACIFLPGNSESLHGMFKSFHQTYASRSTEDPVSNNKGREEEEEKEEEEEGSLLGAAKIKDSLARFQRIGAESSAAKMLAELILSVLARIARRLHWAYFRQLWDDSVHDFLQEDLKREAHLREVITTTKSIEARTRTKLLLSSAVLAKDIPSDAVKRLEGEITALHDRLRNLAVMTGEMNLILQRPGVVKIVPCGTLTLVIFDSAWSHIASDGSLDFSHSGIELDESICFELEAMRNVNLQQPAARLLAVLSANSLLEMTESNGLMMMMDDDCTRLMRQSMLSKSDADRLLRHVLLWQQADESRVAFSTGISGYFASLCSQIEPVIATTDDNIETDVWVTGRCQLAEVLLRPLHQKRRKISITPLRQVSNTIGSPNERSSEAIFQRSIISAEVRACYWLAEYGKDERVFPQGTMSDTLLCRPATLSIAAVVSQPLEHAGVVCGPVVGKVTASCATVLMELCGSHQNVGLVCVDAMTGMEARYCKDLSEGNPSVILFEGLHPNRHYHIYLDSCNDGRSLGTCLASFTTLRANGASLSDFFGDHARLVRSAATTVGHPSGGSADSFRLLVLGACHPAHSCDMLSSESSDVGVQVRDSFRMIRDVSHLLTEPWSGFDLVIHIAACAGWVDDFHSALSALARAEDIQSTSGSREVFQQHMRSAEQAIRDGFRTHWGADANMRRLLANGSHHFVVQPTLELLETFRVMSLRELRRDLSSFCVSNLLTMLSRAQADYVQCLWADCSRCLASDCVIVHSLAQCLLITLVPEFIGMDCFENNLLSDRTITTLSSALIDSSLSESSLVICCALPIVTAGGTVQRSSFGNQLSTLDASRVLDLCYQWAARVRGRQVILISGTSRSFHTEIVVKGAEIDCTLNQICCGPLVGISEGNSFPERGELPSAMPNVSFQYCHIYAGNEAHGEVSRVPFVAAVELVKDSTVLINWHSPADMRQLRDLSMNTDTFDNVRVKEDAGLLSFTQNLLPLWAALASKDASNMDAQFVASREVASAVEQILAKESSALLATFDILNQRYLLPSGTLLPGIELFCHDQVSTVLAQMNPAMSALLRTPTAPVLRCAWKAFRGAQPSGVSLAKLLTNYEHFVRFVTLALTFQLCSEIVAHEMGLLD